MVETGWHRAGAACGIETKGELMNQVTRCSVRRLVALCATAPFALLGAAYAAQTHPDKGAKAPTAAQKFKNIQVLKSLPADRLIPTMHVWNDSLGVRCDFCHAVETNAAGQHVGWEKDVKPEKTMARKMAVMTMKLHKGEKLLEGRASCFMCHHGHATPELKAPGQTTPGAAR